MYCRFRERTIYFREKRLSEHISTEDDFWVNCPRSPTTKYSLRHLELLEIIFSCFKPSEWYLNSCMTND